MAVDLACLSAFPSGRMAATWIHTYPKQNQFYWQFQFYKNWTLSISHAGWIRRRAPDISTLMCLETEFWRGLVNCSIIAAMNSYAKLSEVSVRMISTTQIKRGRICVHLTGHAIKFHAKLLQTMNLCPSICIDFFRWGRLVPERLYWSTRYILR